MVTVEDVKRAQRMQMYCVGVMLLCGVAWGTTWYRGGPELIHEWSGLIAMLSLLVCYFFSLTTENKEEQDQEFEDFGVEFMAAYMFAVAFDAAGEASLDFWKRCEVLKPHWFTVEEWAMVVAEYHKKQRGEPSLV